MTFKASVALPLRIPPTFLTHPTSRNPWLPSSGNVLMQMHVSWFIASSPDIRFLSGSTVCVLVVFPIFQFWWLSLWSCSALICNVFCTQTTAAESSPHSLASLRFVLRARSKLLYTACSIPECPLWCCSIFVNFLDPVYDRRCYCFQWEPISLLLFVISTTMAE